MSRPASEMSKPDNSISILMQYDATKANKKNYQNFPEYIYWSCPTDTGTGDWTKDKYAVALFNKRQKKEYQAALKFAEREILSKEISTISPGKWAEIIRELHKVAAKTLVNEVAGAIAGKYRDKKQLIIANREKYAQKSIDNILKELSKSTIKEDKDKYLPLKVWVEKFRNFKLTGSQTNLDMHYYILRNKGHITDQEHTFIEKNFFRIFAAANISTRMEDFTKELVKMINNKEDPIKIGCFAHKMITDIHPFNNGSGRIARIIMNSIFMSFKIEPVLIDDCGPIHDLYHKEVEKSDKDLGSFIQFIGSRLKLQQLNQVRYPKEDPVKKMEMHLASVGIIDETDEKLFLRP